MIVADSQVLMQASRQAVTRDQQRESLTYWEDGERSRTVTNNSESERTDGIRLQYERVAAGFSRTHIRSRSVLLDLSERARELQHKNKTDKKIETASTTTETESTNQKAELEVSLIKLLVEHFTGRKLQLFDPQELQAKTDEIQQQAEQPQSDHPAADESVGWGLRYQYSATHFESEKVSFKASATVKTADGKEIELELELNMSRQFYTEESLTLTAGDALKDPLVINFSGNAAELTQSKFSFDIDSNGRQERISFVKSGSGFLAYDKNQDGKINDGSELFGATTGDGFAELAAYDEDGNRWIDENDSLCDKLRIWTKDTDGKDQLVALGVKNVGAIYLGATATQFSLNDTDNQQLGQVRQTGIYISEDGSAGSVQQLDLVV